MPPRVPAQAFCTTLQDIDMDHDLTVQSAIIQKRSHSPLDLTPTALDKLLLQFQAFPSVSKIFEVFVKSDSEYYTEQTCAHFSGDARAVRNKGMQILLALCLDIDLWTPAALELCCLLKYVQKNNRPDQKGSNAWSIRQMGFYQSYRSSTQAEAILLVHHSDALDIASSKYSSTGAWNPDRSCTGLTCHC